MCGDIVVGCWINTGWGEAVVTDISTTRWVYYRYQAIRGIDDQEIWVANADPINNVTYLKPQDELSTEVLSQHRDNEPYLILEVKKMRISGSRHWLASNKECPQCGNIIWKTFHTNRGRIEPVKTDLALIDLDVSIKDGLGIEIDECASCGITISE